MVRYQINVHGRVQGVGFRYFCKTVADSLNVSGWVRNSANGGVEIEAQGTQEVMNSFLSHLEQGPPLAHVSGLDKTELGVGKVVAPFEVRY